MEIEGNIAEERDNENDFLLSSMNYNQDILKPKILVFGIGGAGTNAVNNMINDDLRGVDFVVANTDAQSLSMSLAENKIQLGPNTTRGLGAGMLPEVGREATEEVIDEIATYLDGVNMLFITAGMGGGTGTGSAPVIAKMAKERDILTAAVVTTPFTQEGNQRMLIAEKGIEELKKYVDTLIVVPNQNLFKIANDKTTLKESFEMVDEVLKSGVKGITDLITMPGLINLDFADVKTVMRKMGKAMMGTGEAKGENRAIKAVEEAISNPLLDNVSIKGAKGVIVNITGSPDITLFEFNEASKMIRDQVDPNASIIVGSAFNKDMDGLIRVSVFATGISDNSERSLASTYNKMRGLNENMVYEEYEEETVLEEKVIRVDRVKLEPKLEKLDKEPEEKPMTPMADDLEEVIEKEPEEVVDEKITLVNTKEQKNKSNRNLEDIMNNIDGRVAAAAENENYKRNIRKKIASDDDAPTTAKRENYSYDDDEGFFDPGEPYQVDEAKNTTSKRKTASAPKQTRSEKPKGEKKSLFSGIFGAKKPKENGFNFLNNNDDLDIDIGIYNVPAYLRNKESENQ